MKVTFSSSCTGIIVVGLAEVWKENLIIAKCMLGTERRVSCPNFPVHFILLNDWKIQGKTWLRRKDTHIYINRDNQAGLYVCCTENTLGQEIQQLFTGL